MDSMSNTIKYIGIGDGSMDTSSLAAGSVVYKDGKLVIIGTDGSEITMADTSSLIDISHPTIDYSN